MLREKVGNPESASLELWCQEDIPACCSLYGNKITSSWGVVVLMEVVVEALTWILYDVWINHFLATTPAVQKNPHNFCSNCVNSVSYFQEHPTIKCGVW